jgi:hypothetical protein
VCPATGQHLSPYLFCLFFFPQFYLNETQDRCEKGWGHVREAGSLAHIHLFPPPKRDLHLEIAKLKIWERPERSPGLARTLE